MEVPSTLAANSMASPGPDPASDFSSTKSGSGYTITRITSEKEVTDLESDWDRLSESATTPNVFMTYGWFRGWNQRFTQEDRNGRRPNVLVIKKGSAVVGISPLILRKVSRLGFGARKLEFVGMEADYNDLVLGGDPAGQSEAIVDFLAQTQDQWDLVNLRDLRDTGNSIARVEHALSQAGLTFRLIPEQERCPYLPIDARWSDMVAKFSPSTRHTFRKQQRRLDRMHGESLRIRVIENPHEEPGLLEKLIALESQKHVHGELSPPFIAKYPEVFQSLFDSLGPRGWLLIAAMELADRAVALQIFFRCGKKLWGFHTAYDHDFSRLSPGTMLVTAMIDYGFEHGYDEYDFLRGDEPYKSRWSTGVHQSYWLRVWSGNWIARAHALVYLDLKPTIEKLFAPRTDQGVREQKSAR